MAISIKITRAACYIVGALDQYRLSEEDHAFAHEVIRNEISKAIRMYKLDFTEDRAMFAYIRKYNNIQVHTPISKLKPNDVYKAIYDLSLI